MNTILLALQAALCLLAVQAGPFKPVMEVPIEAHGIPIEIMNLLPRIVGGQDATPEEFPFIVRLIDNDHGGSCGASIINDEFVLTAAHCVYDSGTWADPEKIIMVVGIQGYDIQNSPYEQMVTGSELYHMDYDSENNINDIAVVRLAEKLNFGPKVQSVCLASGTNTFADRTADIMGWGVNAYGWFGPQSGVPATTPHNLQKIQMKIISPSSCAQKIGPANAAPDKICIVDAQNVQKGVCSGDSGGPMVVNENGKYVQVGIASFITAPCGQTTTHPSVYARVTYFRQWIQQVTGSSLAC